jgi:C1A family cysteine protease
MKYLQKTTLIAVLMTSLCLVACSPEDLDGYTTGTQDPILTDLDVLMAGAPQRGDPDYPPDIKADMPLPKQYFDLLESQSPVKNQGKRGACTAFSVVSYMEHLYRVAGVPYTPDFSEQYLYWSTKVQLGAFPDIRGSTTEKTIEAVNAFGVVAEEKWPYESSYWDKKDDRDCDGSEEMPTKCYTNGDPPQKALDAHKWFLPKYRWVSTSAESIKAFMYNNKIAVVGIATYFDQAWSSKDSELLINKDYRKKGYVITPNDEDYEKSTVNRSGHAILIVGWDDEMEVQRLDVVGRPIHKDGLPVVEQGFFLFKNSWGTDDWGSENSKRAGYGWISYDYIYKYGWMGASDLPTTDVPQEFKCDDGQDNDNDGNADCDDFDCFHSAYCRGASEIVCYDGIDNDDDGYTDCGDFDCGYDPVCQYEYEYHTHENTSEYDIPDNDLNGITSSIYIFLSGQIIEFQLILNITHTYLGDLEVQLKTPAGVDITVIRAYDKAWGEGEEHVFNLEDLQGEEINGDWTLKIMDTVGQDVGTLNGWKIKVKI